MHTKGCLSNALISAIEDYRDGESISDHDFRVAAQDNFLAIADEYLANSPELCLCPIEVATRKADEYVYYVDSLLNYLVHTDIEGANFVNLNPLFKTALAVERVRYEGDPERAVRIARHPDNIVKFRTVLDILDSDRDSSIDFHMGYRTPGAVADLIDGF